MKEFRLPDPGEGLVEAEIVTWHVAEGDTVTTNDIVVEVETSKSLVELPIPFDGTVAKLLVAEGDTVEVGAPIIVIDDGSGDGAEAAPAAESGEADDSDGRVANLVGYGPRQAQAKRRPRKGAVSNGGAAEARAEVHERVASAFSPEAPVSRRTDVAESLAPTGDQPSGAPLPVPGRAQTEPGIATGTVLAKPPVRKLAKDLGVDLTAVVGSGNGGVITRDDVLAASDTSVGSDATATPSGTPTSAGPAGSPRHRGLPAAHRVPIKGVRKHMAQAMVQSAFTAPHVTEWLTVDVTATMELLQTLQGRREFREVRVSPTVVAAKAVCLALAQHPDLNAAWDDAAQEIVHHGQVNLGIAAATDRGLVVPNIPAADTLSLVDLAGALDELVTVARSGRTPPEAMRGGTFTITNVGVFGIDAGTPIINPGESAILALGAIQRRPWVVGSGDDERIEPRSVMTLAISFDHRLIDGATGSRFLAAVGELLANPGLALLH